MKKGFKLFAAGAAVAAVAGLIAYKKYQDSYEQLTEEEAAEVEIPEEDDFVPMEEIDDGFDYLIEEELIEE